MLALILLSISISDHSDRAHSLRVQNWEGWFIHQRLCCHSEGPTQAGEIQPREKPSPAPGEEQPQAPGGAGGCLAGEQLGRKGPGHPGGHHTEHEPAACPSHKD